MFLGSMCTWYCWYSSSEMRPHLVRQLSNALDRVAFSAGTSCWYTRCAASQAAIHSPSFSLNQLGPTVYFEGSYDMTSSLDSLSLQYSVGYL